MGASEVFKNQRFRNQLFSTIAIIATLNSYSNGFEEKGFGTPFAIDVADFVPKIFEELDSMWNKRPQSLGSYWDEMKIHEVSVLVEFSKFGLLCSFA